LNPEAVLEMLKRNFDRSYTGLTRAPFGLYVHAAWFFGQEFRSGLPDFSLNNIPKRGKIYQTTTKCTI
jgi:hypothetical protein